MIAPGLRYAFENAAEQEFAAGFSVPIGLNEDTDDWGVVGQVRFGF